MIPVISQDYSNKEQFTSLLSTNLYDENYVYSDDLGGDLAAERVVTKHEQQDDPAPQTLLQKEEINADSLDIKFPPNPPEWHPSQDLMGIILGSDFKTPEFGIRLNDDLYIEGNKQLETNVFPVSIPSINRLLTNYIEQRQFTCSSRDSILEFTNVRVEGRFGSS